MEETRTIEIDFDVHKLIESERTSFAESPNSVIRRLLGIKESQTRAVPVQKSGSVDWSGKGVALPHGTEVRMEYNGRVHNGRIDQGKWLVEGRVCHSPSGAANSVAITKGGNHTKLDGWKYWQVKRPTDSRWRLIQTLRRSV